VPVTGLQDADILPQLFYDCICDEIAVILCGVGLLKLAFT
jgi:hypothetical protein